MVSFLEQFSGALIALIGASAGGLSTWLLTTYKFNRENRQRKAHLKAKLLDEILDQCRRIVKKLNNYEKTLSMYKTYLDDDEPDPETGYPRNMLDLETEPAYKEYINGLQEAKEVLRHKHQDYVIKTKSDEIEVLNKIDESLTKMINYESSQDFDYSAANMEYLEVYTNLRMIHNNIKDVYPEEVPID